MGRRADVTGGRARAAGQAVIELLTSMPLDQEPQPSMPKGPSDGLHAIGKGSSCE
jgi:hypothetical protein